MPTKKKKKQAKNIELNQQVCQAMKKYPSWEGLNAQMLILNGSNGGGGSKTYRVSAPQECDPKNLFLHMRKDQEQLARLLSVQTVFQKYDVCPKLKAVGKNFWLDQWKEGKDEFCWKQFGRLLATIHRIPTDWWQPIKKGIYQKQPNAVDFPAGSLAWAYIQNQCWYDILNLEATTRTEMASVGITNHPIAGRIVTSHGDYHPGNIVHQDGRMFCIDYEYSCVTHAVQDLAFGVACCGQDLLNKQVFLTAYLLQLGQSVTEKDVKSLQIQAQLYQITSWHSGGILAPWELKKLSDKEVTEIIDDAKQFLAQVRSSQQKQEAILKSRLQSFIRQPGNIIYQKNQKKLKIFYAQADEYANRFNIRLLQIPQKLGKIQISEDVSKSLTWQQAPQETFPLKIGEVSKLGMMDSFTALCWVKDQKQSIGTRCPIFMGDVNPQAHKADWHDFKSKIMHLELRDYRYYFGFGWDDASSSRVCRTGKWDHVAFVFEKKGDQWTKKIIVNGQTAQNRWGTQSKLYEGDECIWLGDSLNHDFGRWVGQIKGGMIFNQALNEKQVHDAAVSTYPLEL